MSATTDLIEKQEKLNARLLAVANGLQEDIDFLKARIAQLEGNGGATPEEQAELDKARAMTEALVARVEAIDSQTVKEGGNGA